MMWPIAATPQLCSTNMSGRVKEKKKKRKEKADPKAKTPFGGLKRSRELDEQFDTGDIVLVFSKDRTLRLDAAQLQRASPVLRGMLSTDEVNKGLGGTQRLNVRR